MALARAPDGAVIAYVAVTLRGANRLEILEPGGLPRAGLASRCTVETPSEPIALALTPDDKTVLLRDIEDAVSRGGGAEVLDALLALATHAGPLMEVLRPAGARRSAAQDPPGERGDEHRRSRGHRRRAIHGLALAALLPHLAFDESGIDNYGNTVALLRQVLGGRLHVVPSTS